MGAWLPAAAAAGGAPLPRCRAPISWDPRCTPSHSIIGLALSGRV
jgi:hypothetical protein